MRNDFHRTVALLSAAAVLLGSVPGFAQDPHSEDTAEQHYQAAASLFGEGRYREALDEFDAAIAISPEPVFYCNRAVVLVKLREPVAAVESMQVCRNTFEGSDEELAQIDAQTLAMETFVSTVRSRSSEVARDIAAGPVVVEGPAPAPADDSWDLASTGYVTLAIGLAVLGGALTLDLLSADLRDEFIAQSEGGSGTSRERYDELKADYDQRQLIFYGLAAGGAVLTVAGGILVAWDLLDSSEEVSVGATPTPGGAVGTVQFRF